MLRMAEEAVDLGSSLGATQRHRANLALAAGLAVADHQSDRIDELTRDSVEYFTETGDAWRLASSHLAAAAAQPTEASLGHIRNAGVASTKAGDDAMVANAKYWEATILVNSGNDLDRAASLARDAVAISEAIGNENEIAHAQSVLAIIALREQRFEYVAAMTSQLVPMFRRVADHRCEARMETFSILARLAEDQREGAKAALERAIEIARRSGSQLTEAEALDALASLADGKDAVRLHAAAATTRGSVGVHANPSGINYASQIERLQNELGRTEFDAAWADGRSQSPV
jgi:hypothetical protein